MNIGIFAWFGFPIPIAERAKLIKEVGYQSVMLWWADDHMDTDGPKEDQPDLFRSLGLKIANIHTPFADASQIWTDTLRGQMMEDALSKCLLDCHRFDIPVAVVHVTAGKDPPPPGPIGIKRFARLAEQAERLGVDIALENLRYPQYLDYVYDRVPSERLKFCYDSGHENCRSPHMDFLEKYGDKLAALHLHDNDGTEDQHILPFDGTVPWERVARHVKRLDYPGDLTLEIDKFHGNNPSYTAQDFLTEGMDRMKRFIKLMEAE